MAKGTRVFSQLKGVYCQKSCLWALAITFLTDKEETYLQATTKTGPETSGGHRTG